MAPAEVLLSGVYGEKGIKVEKEAKVLDYGWTRLEIAGEIAGEKIEYVADVLSKPYLNLGSPQQRMGIPPSIGVRMIKGGKINQKGCYLPHIGIDPKIYFKELSKRNIAVSYDVRYLI